MASRPESIRSRNLTQRLDDLVRGDRDADTTCMLRHDAELQRSERSAGVQDT